MPKINIDWVKQQLEDSKTPTKAANTVLNLMKIWEKETLTAEQAKNAAEIFSKLCQGIPLELPVDEDELLVPARPGNLIVGDYVVVAQDAYSDPAVHFHNGRRGRIVGIRYGDIIVKYEDGKSPQINDARHSPFKLLKVIKKND